VFVVFEGGEGAGKSTQLALLAASLRSDGAEVVTTREPGGTATAEAIREVLLAPADAPMSDRCEALLFAAARADHVAAVIAPALARGAVVLCDRYIDSSLAYQGFARSLDVAEVADISSWATGGLLPDLTVLLDIDPQVGLARAGSAPDRLESESIDFHRAVRDGMLTLAAAEPGRYLTLAADGDVARIAARVQDAVAELMRRPVVR
jgi:dTMP kinase